MNPYIQQALVPQIDELRRQAEISRMENAQRLTGAGAFGGTRQAIMDAELDHLPEAAFNLKGTIEEAIESGEKMIAEAK